MQTAAGDARQLQDVADHLDPERPNEIHPEDLGLVAEKLRETARRLERIATGGDAKASDEAGD